MLPLLVCTWSADWGLSVASLFPQTTDLGCVETEHFFPLANKLKEFLDDPSAFVTDSPVTADIISAPTAAVEA